MWVGLREGWREMEKVMAEYKKVDVKNKEHM
jgi:hypothetical protein